ncbi:Methyltransferase domain [Seminavis robusta]|uniref:Methyltransferase domain n=1 Tax=Seminavis robusta TaxID=568900 RepID=A0A9N8D9L9_9STRA|nr:Methyltransferase domain [Seminavis robusta]|eukprot:Sro49_g028530.1 Methyltransferase domain (500) ;mRNA; f:20968-22742
MSTMGFFRILFLLLQFSALGVSCQETAEDFLSLGDTALSQDENAKAIPYYQEGIKRIDPEEDSLLIILSLHTNHGSALSSIGKDQEAAEQYQHALTHYANEIDDIVEESFKRDATEIAAQASFFLGMVYQDLKQFHDAVEAYSYAHVLDPNHWASVANLAAVYHDSLSAHQKALAAYQTAYEILTDTQRTPTDAPEEPRYILSQLQYRIGLCISHDLSPNKKCAMDNDPDTPVSCKELATNAFARALEYDPDNEPSKHMLATITADATMSRASNTYIKSLFDDYAENFEHSLVQELGYTGYERLRRVFDRAFQPEDPPMFQKVVDAGCGTGLVGEQFRNVSKHLIGVDLSEAIIVEAQKARPNLYDEVRVGDVTEVFRAEAPLSMIVAADSYIYFGDLDPLFGSMKDGLASGGYAAFTLENVSQDSEESLTESKPDWRWQLTASGRFAHRKEYVMEVGKRHNLHVKHYEPLHGFRYERGEAVRGHAFIMVKGEDGHDEL